MADFAVAVASNNAEILNANLRRSPMIEAGHIPLHIEEDAPSASIAYNRLLDVIDADIVVFAHQDVYLPLGWDSLLRARIAELYRHDPDWALLGAYGVDLDLVGFGPVWATSLGGIVGKVSTTPVEVQSYDELLIIMRKSKGLRFDEKLPHFHMYGTDIVQIARAAGLKSYVMSLPVVHNDRFHEQLDENFAAGYHYIRRKWRAHLPLWTPVLKVAWHGLHLARVRHQNVTSKGVRLGMARSDDVDARTFAQLCGWFDLTPSTYTHPRIAAAAGAPIGSHASGSNGLREA